MLPSVTTGYSMLSVKQNVTKAPWWVSNRTNLTDNTARRTGCASYVDFDVLRIRLFDLSRFNPDVPNV